MLVNVNLLRAKMALKGHFNWADLADLLELSRSALNSRLTGQTEWTVPEIRKIVLHYNLTEKDACDTFGLMPADED